MKDRFSIGEMSRLHNIPIKTLRYYDEIGLFKPIEVDGNNSYRYYSIEQFEQLNTINYLKFLGLSLKEIQRHLEIRDVGSFLELLKHQREITATTISRLELVKNQFSNRIEEINGFLNMGMIEEPILKTLPVRAIISLHEPIYSEYEWELALRRLVEKTNGHPVLFIGRVGLTVSRKNLHDKKFDEYNSVFILWEEPIDEAQAVSYLREGDYACIHYRGNHNQSKKHYDRLMRFIETAGYEIEGDSIERTVINQYITNDANKRITEIQIPVKKTC
jgi:DNA-binding transcriptional MerR regulator